VYFLFVFYLSFTRILVVSILAIVGYTTQLAHCIIAALARTSGILPV